jgi:hypothetical protein
LRGLWLKQFVKDSRRLEQPDTGSCLDITAVDTFVPTVFVDYNEAPL